MLGLRQRLLILFNEVMSQNSEENSTVTIESIGRNENIRKYNVAKLRLILSITSPSMSQYILPIFTHNATFPANV